MSYPLITLRASFEHSSNSPVWGGKGKGMRMGSYGRGSEERGSEGVGEEGKGMGRG
jgi:hypothetical protein